jgi:small subunit ribosomal protein S20
MPQRKATAKSIRQTKKRTEHNKARKTRVRSSVRAAVEAARAPEAELKAALSQAYSDIDKAAKTGALHPRAADRKKSRLMRSVKKATH